MAPPPPPTRTEASKKAVGSWISGNAYNVSHNSGKKQVEDQNIKFENDYQNQVPSNNGQHHDLDQPGGESSEAEGFEGATETLSEEDDSSTMSPANCCGDADDDKVNLVEEHFVEHHSPKAKSGTSTMERRSQLSTSRVSVATQVSNSDEQENTDGSDEDEREKKSATLPRIYAKHNKGTSMATNRNNGDLSPSRYHRKSFGHAGEMPLTLSKITDFRNAAVESPSKVLEKSVKPLTTMEMMSKRQQFLTTPSPPSSSLSLSPIKTTPPLSGNGRHGISATSSPTFKARMRSSTMATSTPLLSQQRWTSSATNLLLSTGATVLGGSLGFERRAAESSHFVIIAIDFGTTYSGYAFCFKQKPNDIHVMHKWPGDPDLSNQKTRTALLLKPNGDFDSFGFVARDRYHDLKPSEAAEYYFFEKFKMVLHHDKSLSRDTQITAVNGRSLPAAAVFRHALRFFRDHALSEIGESCGLDAGLSEEDVRWVLTVPAIWRQPAKQLMREAAYKAGMASPDNPDRLLIALEPEAAAIYCRKLKFWDLKDRAPAMSTHTWHGNSCLTEYVIKELDKGTTYMVVDCGGGTVDITVHEIMDSEGNMKEIHKASGDACGSIEVDRAFEDLMENVFGETEFRAWKRKYPSAYVHLLASFEAKKRYARPSKQDAANVSLPLAFITAFERQKKGAVEEAIQKCGITGVSWTEQGMIRLAPKKMQDLFRPTLDQLVKLVEDVLTSLPDRKINYLFLVGGFAESPLLQDRIKKEFQERTKVIIPSDPAVVVLKGASMFGVDPSVVKVRRARMTYGVGVLYPFNPKIHPQEKKVRQGDIDWCADCFDKFVVEDDSVQLGDVLLRRYTPARHDQTTLVLQLYGSKKADAEFITDQGVKHCGSLRLDLTQTRLDVAYSRNPIREIQVRMVLGDTEIRASALDLATGYHVKTNIDFLAY